MGKELLEQISEYSTLTPQHYEGVLDKTNGTIIQSDKNINTSYWEKNTWAYLSSDTFLN